MYVPIQKTLLNLQVFCKKASSARGSSDTHLNGNPSYWKRVSIASIDLHYLHKLSVSKEPLA